MFDSILYSCPYIQIYDSAGEGRFMNLKISGRSFVFRIDIWRHISRDEVSCACCRLCRKGITVCVFKYIWLYVCYFNINSTSPNVTYATYYVKTTEVWRSVCVICHSAIRSGTSAPYSSPRVSYDHIYVSPFNHESEMLSSLSVRFSRLWYFGNGQSTTSCDIYMV